VAEQAAREKSSMRRMNEETRIFVMARNLLE
jgi:hypothetical protein